LDKRPSYRKLIAQLTAVLGQHVRKRNVTLVDRARERLGVDAIILAPMLSDAELLCPCRVEHQRLVTCLQQPIVNPPGLAARFE
jgi:hypothetical protein